MSCVCNICAEKRRSYEKYKDYRRTLKKIRDEAKSKYNLNKFMENQGNSKKTLELINRIRGKQHRQLKPMFIIDNEKITNRRNIANEFNKYFVSLASNLNNGYNEIGELENNQIASFHDYLPNPYPSSMYMSKKMVKLVTYPYMLLKNLTCYFSYFMCIVQ